MDSGPRYEEWRPRPALRSHVACTWGARFGCSGEPHTDRILPDGCMDLVWTGERLLVAGPDTRATPLEPRPDARLAGLRFRPGIAPAFLGVPAHALVDQRLDVREVLGRRLARLTDALAATRSIAEAAAALETGVADALATMPAPDRLVQGAVEALRDPRASIGSLAGDLGVTERLLHRRFRAAVGYGPKMLQRVLRLRRFMALSALRARRPALAELALDAGFADQAHLTRDCQRLAGLPPARLAGALLTRG
jgi:AraC-like DNA-binding protein